MGFLKLIVKQNAGKEYLRNAVNYITENADACFYSGINICPERAYKQMRKVKKYYGKTSGNQLVHFVLLCLDGLGFGDESASLAVQRQNSLNVLAGVFTLDLEAGNDLFGVFSDILDIQHGDFPFLYEICN